MNKSTQSKHRRGILIFGSPVVYFYGTNLIIGTILRGYTPYVIDSETSFNPYAICRSAHRVGLDPRNTLKKIKIARAFNPYQTLEIIKNLPNSRSNVVFLLGPLTLLQDHDLSISEQEILYKELRKLIDETIHRGQWVVSLQDIFNRRITEMITGIQGKMGLVIKIEKDSHLKIIKNDLGIRALSPKEVREWVERSSPTPLF